VATTIAATATATAGAATQNVAMALF